MNSKGTWCPDIKCAYCGGHVPVVYTEDYVFKTQGKYFCRYTHMEKYLREHNKPVIKGPKSSAVPSLAAIRKYFGLTQNEVAAYLGTAEKTYKRYEEALNRMSLARLDKLAEGFGCTVDDITSGEFDSSLAANWVCVIPHLKK